MLKRLKTRHDLDLEALLKALEPADLNRVLIVKDSTLAIWTGLKNEHEKPLDFEYI